MKPILLLVLFVILHSSGIFNKNLTAQIIIDENDQAPELVEKIVGPNVYVENETLTAHWWQPGFFLNGNSTNLGLDEGVVLTTGCADLVPGPNYYWNGSANCYTASGSYEPLTSLIPYSTHDAAVLEFDIIPESDTIHFRYVFGSEEYSDKLHTPTAYDVFGCFITGPSPDGGNYENENIAYVPGTNGLPICPENINNGWAQSWVIPTGPCNNCEYFKDNTNGPTLEYDGFTVVLDASIEVVPCETYHIILAIADSDGLWGDSGVFIEANNLYSPVLSTEISDTVLIEGCSEADIVLKIPDADFAPVSAFLDYSGGTANPAAWPDGDFEEALPTEVTFNVGEDSLVIHVVPVYDGITEGNETLQIIIEYSLTCMPRYDTLVLVINDYIEMVSQTSPNTMLCTGGEVDLWVNASFGAPPYSYQWQGLPFTTDTITITPNISTWYFVNVTDQCQETITDSIHINVLNPLPVALGNDTSICMGDELTLQPEQNIYNSYYWSTGDSTESITVSQPGTYILEATSQCGTSSDEIIIDQWPYPDPDLGPDLYLCYGETDVLNAAFGFVSYTWQDNSTDDYYIVTQGGLYFVNVEDVHGCMGSDTVFAVVGDIVQLEDSLVLCEGETTTIHSNPGFNNYTWSTGQSGVDSIVVSEPGWYTVNVSYVFGCPSEDSTFVEAVPVPTAEITGEDLLCEGDTLWLVAPDGKYEYYWNDELSSSNQLMVTSGGNYTLKTVNTCGEDEDSKYIQSYPLPDVDLGEDILLFPGESINIDAGFYQTYIWNNDPGQAGQYYTIAYDNIQDQDSIWVEVFDGFCKNTDDIIIEVFNVKVPNVITPNGDGFNDRFLPGEGWSGINKHKIIVFNRWGETIWESSDFNSGWDGKNNGRFVANGTYFWILEVWYGKEDIKKVYKGSLTVLGSGN